MSVDTTTAPLPSRRARREAEREAERRAKAASSRGRLQGLSALLTRRFPLPVRPRTAAVAVLAGAAVGVPGTAMLGTTVLPAYAAAPAATTSVLGVVNESSATSELEGSTRAHSLTLDEAGVARAQIVAASLNSPSVTCAPADAANGIAAGMTDAPSGPQIVVPMAEGTFRISSPYGGRIHPIFGVARMHNGTDFAAPAGTPIHAVAAGTVVHAGPNIGEPGTLVIVQHEIDGKIWSSWYLHMYAQDIAVTEGQQVNAGDLVGLVGSAGNSTGPHLHLEIHEGEGTAAPTVDPMAWLADNGATSSADAVC